MRQLNQVYINALARKPLREIRHMQRINALLIERAAGENLAALEELQVREREYMFAILQRTR